MIINDFLCGFIPHSSGGVDRDRDGDRLHTSSSPAVCVSWYDLSLVSHPAGQDRLPTPVTSPLVTRDTTHMDWVCQLALPFFSLSLSYMLSELFLYRPVKAQHFSHLPIHRGCHARGVILHSPIHTDGSNLGVSIFGDQTLNWGSRQSNQQPSDYWLETPVEASYVTFWLKINSKKLQFNNTHILHIVHKCKTIYQPALRQYITSYTEQQPSQACVSVSRQQQMMTAAVTVADR